MAFVLDNSVSMAWCFEDQATPYTDRVLDLLLGDAAHVPAIWPLEVANAVVVGARRRILPTDRSARFMGIVRMLPIIVDEVQLERALGAILDIARATQLTAYDASYLELAQRRSLPLATKDGRLSAAARQLGVDLVQ